jgi:O-antigen ligase
MTSSRAISIRHPITPVIPGMYGARIQVRAESVRVRLVNFLVVAVFALCMSAPELLLAPVDPNALNPFAGSVKLLLLVLGGTLVVLCRSSRNLKIITSPFGWLIAWALVCWIFTGAAILPLRNLVSSFGGILILAGLCGAADVVGGIRRMVRLMVYALLITAAVSLLLGLLDLQAMPGERALASQLELFHGVGTPGYMDAACAVLIAWVLAWQLAVPSSRSSGLLLLLIIIPALSFLRAYFAGIVATIMAAALLAWWRRRKTPKQKWDRGSKRVVMLALLGLCAGVLVFFLKTDSRGEGSELSGREVIWPIEIASVVQHPLFGLGPFGDIQLLFFDENLPQVGAAHSDYLGAAVCYGLPGLFLFVAALARVWKRVRRYQASSVEERACRDAAFLALVGLATTIIAENVIRDPRTFSLHLLFPALCLSAAAYQQRKPTR